MRGRISCSPFSAVCVLVGVVAFSQAIFAQEAITPGAKTFYSHVASRAPLVYPAIAKAARIEGTVVLSLTVGAEGNVISMKAISGPPMLIQAAKDSAKQWKFRPFEMGGKRVPAQGRLSFIFSLGDTETSSSATEPVAEGHTNGNKTTIKIVRVKDITPGNSADAKTASKFFPLWDKCTKGVIAHKHGSETAAICRQAADVASTFPPDARYVEKRSAFVYAATAFANAGDFKDGEIYALKAVAEVKLGHDDDGGNGAAYSTLGQIEAMQGEFADADRNLTTAEDFERKGAAWAGKNAPSIAHDYTNALLGDLRAHVYVLNRLNRPVDAQEKLDEETKLNR